MVVGFCAVINVRGRKVMEEKKTRLQIDGIKDQYSSPAFASNCELSPGTTEVLDVLRALENRSIPSANAWKLGG